MPTETETEEPRTDYEPHDDPHEFEGGPVKTFLEHLEDLRWVLIKSLTAIGVAFVVCLLAGPQVIAIVKYPLARAKIKYLKNIRVLSFGIGTNRLWTCQIAAEQKTGFDFGTNQVISYELTPVLSGTNLVMGL